MISLLFVYAKNNNLTQNHFKKLFMKVFWRGVWGETFFQKSFSPQKTATKVFEERFGEGLFPKSPFPRNYKSFWRGVWGETSARCQKVKRSDDFLAYRAYAWERKRVVVKKFLLKTPLQKTFIKSFWIGFAWDCCYSHRQKRRESVKWLNLSRLIINTKKELPLRAILF